MVSKVVPERSLARLLDQPSLGRYSSMLRLTLHWHRVRNDAHQHLAQDIGMEFAGGIVLVGLEAARSFLTQHVLQSGE